MDERVAQTIRSLEASMETFNDASPLPREAARFVHALVRAMRARHVVEIGTGYGYSGLWLASALAGHGGRLTTIDSAESKSESARERFREAALHHIVTFLIGKAGQVLRDVSGPIDLVLNDADKENCRAYVELVLPQLREGGVVVTDNTRTHRGELAPFMGWIRSHSAFTSTELTIGNGMELSIMVGAGR